MSSSLFTMHDIIEISPQKSLVDLSKTDKHKFMDRILDAKREDKRGLSIEFNLSSAGRRINNRIYTPTGQRAGIESWTAPYPKPIIRNHDKSEDPMGRFSKVEYSSLDDKALAFFKNAKEFMFFKDALESDQPARIIKALKQNKLLTSNKWPGIGELVANARIFDEGAIEKFLDGRYMTFSAGSHTDRYVCSKCLTDWALGEHCDHRAGQVTEDGDLVFFVTGGFYGEEGSVITNPANDYSSMRSLSFADSLNYSIPQSECMTDTSTIYITDSSVDFADAEGNSNPMETNMDEINVQALVDALLPKILEKLKDSANSQVAEPSKAKPVVDWATFDAAVATLKESLSDAQVVVEKEVVVRDSKDIETINDLNTQLTAAVTAKDAAEAEVVELKTKVTALEDSQKDHVAALALADELKGQIENLTKELDTVKTSLQNQDRAAGSVLDNNRGSVQNPSESGAPALRDGVANKLKDLGGYEQTLVKQFHKIRDSHGEGHARAYIKNLQGKGQLSKTFNIDLYIKETN